MTSRCEQCGAAHGPDDDCESCFHALLAFENENPPAFGAVHHLTVATYYLQHPRGYAAEALELWQRLIADALSGRVSPAELRQRASDRFEGSKRVRSNKDSVPSWWPKRWPMTVQGVLRPMESIALEDYVERARTWARATCRLLEQAEGAARGGA